MNLKLHPDPHNSCDSINKSSCQIQVINGKQKISERWITRADSLYSQNGGYGDANNEGGGGSFWMERNKGTGVKKAEKQTKYELDKFTGGKK